MGGQMTDTLAFENLDLACAKAGQKIAKKSDLEKTITDALAVLEEQGVYALFLYLNMKDERKQISRALASFLKKTPSKEPLIKEDNGNISRLIQKYIATDIDKLLLAGDLLRQTLIYARYHAKALKEKEKKSDTGEAAA